MNYMNGFTAWLNGEMARLGIGNNELAREAGVSPGLVSMVLNERQSPTERFCIRIAPVLGYKPEDVLRKAGKLPGRPMTRREAALRITELVAQVEDERALLILESTLREMIRQQGRVGEAKAGTGGE